MVSSQGGCAGARHPAAHHRNVIAVADKSAPRKVLSGNAGQFSVTQDA
ncbi:hypothetical protein [Immundisolibacter sp.]